MFVIMIKEYNEFSCKSKDLGFPSISFVRTNRQTNK